MSWRRQCCLGSRKRWRNQCESDIKKMPYPQKIRSSASRFTAHTHTRIITHWATTLVSNASPHSLLSPPPQKQPPAEPLILSRTQTNTHTHAAIQHLKCTRTSRLGRSLAPSPPLKMLHPLRRRRPYPPLPPHSAPPESSVEVPMMAFPQRGYSSDPRSSTCS